MLRTWLNLQSINCKKNRKCLTAEGFLAILRYRSDAFPERIIARFRKQYSEKITECLDSCIHSAMAYPIDDLWIGSLTLADVPRGNFSEIIARYFPNGTRGTDNDSFRYKSSQPSTSSIILHSDGFMGINRIRRRSGRFPMKRRDTVFPDLFLEDADNMSRYLEISICEDDIALHEKRSYRGHFEAIGRSRLTEFVTALYAASKEWMYTYEFGPERLSNEWK